MKDGTRHYVKMKEEQKLSGTERIGFDELTYAYELGVVDSIKLLEVKKYLETSRKARKKLKAILKEKKSHRQLIHKAAITSLALVRASDIWKEQVQEMQLSVKEKRGSETGRVE